MTSKSEYRNDRNSFLRIIRAEDGLRGSDHNSFGAYSYSVNFLVVITCIIILLSVLFHILHASVVKYCIAWGPILLLNIFQIDASIIKYI
jgi:hypothetical protein